MAEPTEPDKPVVKDLTGKIGKYEIVRPLGKGAMGQVYLAHDTVLERDVALKVMVAQIADDPELKQRFEREARAVAKMTHPNVVMVFDLGSHTDGSPYIAMELLKGQDLQKAVRMPPPLPLERKVAIIVQVLAGLAHAHQAGIVHRDIKPANIFIQEDGSVKIMDFGVARLTTASMTGTGNIVGTADYMSPEQVQGKKVDGRSDLFSVGCMLFELAAGRRPFHSDNLMAIFYKITHEEANFDLIPQGADYDALLPLLKKALAKDIDQRYQTAYQFAVDLREWLRAHSTTASTQNVLEQLVDLEAPTHAPLATTDAPGVSFSPTGVAGATVELGRGSSAAPRRPTLAPTRTGGRTVVDPAAGGTVRPGPTRVMPSPARPSPRPQPAPKASLLPIVAIGLALVAVGIAVWLVLRGQQAVTSPPVTQAAAPTPTPTPAPATPLPPPVTAAPAPTFAEPAGKAAVSLRAARSAFAAGDFERAVASAQQAVREDASNTTAAEILTKALAGQKAAVRVRAAEAALARNDLSAAEGEATAALQAAPWYGPAAQLGSRIEAARAQAQREGEAKALQARAAQVNAALNQAAASLQAKQYDAAIAAYEQALLLDPNNVAAQTGRQAAIGSKSMVEAAASGSRSVAPAHAFVEGRTDKKGAEGASGLVCFEDSAGVPVKKGTQAAELPGSIRFEANPASPKAGERYKVSVFFVNEGQQPIQLSAMSVATTVDGKRQSGSLPPMATTAAPGARSLVFQTPGDQLWKEGTTAWTMELTLRTPKGETYRNTLTWK